MKQRHGNQSARFLPAARALAIALTCWCFEALAGNPIPGVDVNLGKNPDGSIAVIQSDSSGKFFLYVKEPGNYTLSTGCKSAGCKPSQLQLNIVARSYPNADGSISYEFHVGKGGLQLQGQTLSLDLPKGTGVKRGGEVLPSLDGSVIPGVDVELGKPGGGSLAAPKPTGIGENEPAGLAGEPIAGLDIKLGKPVGGSLAAPKPTGGGQKEPAGLAGQPIPGVDVELGKNPGGSIAVGRTNSDGFFFFDKLPEGKYTLKLPGLPDKFFSVGPEGKVGGNLMKGSDGKMWIFDRWGNFGVAPEKGDANEAGRRQYEPLVIRKRLDAASPAGFTVAEPAKPDLPAKSQVTALQTARHADGKKVSFAEGHVKTLAAPDSGGGNPELPGLAGEPIPGVDVELGKNPGGIIAVVRTGADGKFDFKNLPEGNYTLKLPGLPSVPVMLGNSGTIVGKVGKTAGGTGYTFFDVFTDLSTAAQKGTGSGGAAGIGTEPPLEDVSFTHRAAGSGGGGRPTNAKGSGRHEGDKAGPIGGFGTGVNSGGPSFGGPNGPGPSMIPAPSMPSMGGPGPMTPGGAGPMSPGGPPVTPMGGYRP